RDEARRAGPVVDDDRLLRQLRELLPKRTRELIGRAARRERHDQRGLLVGKIGVRDGGRKCESAGRDQATKRVSSKHVSAPGPSISAVAGLRRRRIRQWVAAGPVGKSLPWLRRDLTLARFRKIADAVRKRRLQPRPLRARERHAVVGAVERLE